MRFALALLVLGLLSACVPATDSAPKLHDIALYSNASDLNGVYSYFYGQPMTLRVGEREVTLQEGRSSDPLAMPSALLVDGMPYLKRTVTPLRPPPSRVQRIPLTSDVQLEVGAESEAQEILYFDGKQWFTLAREPQPTVGQRVVPRPRLGGLSGLGQLTGEEARRLEAALAPRAPLAITLLPESRVPPRSTDGLGEYRRTALYVQQTVPTDQGAYTPSPRELVWEVLASGNQAVGGDAPSFELIGSEDELIRAWNRAYGSQLNLPPLPEVSFERETVVAFFSETKPSGGYGLEVADVTLENNDLYIDLRRLEPAPGAITTQALTTPWVMIRVLRGGIDAAWFREPGSERLIGVARRNE